MVRTCVLSCKEDVGGSAKLGFVTGHFTLPVVLCVGVCFVSVSKSNKQEHNNAFESREIMEICPVHHGTTKTTSDTGGTCGTWQLTRVVALSFSASTFFWIATSRDWDQKEHRSSVHGLQSFPRFTSRGSPPEDHLVIHLVRSCFFCQTKNHSRQR